MKRSFGLGKTIVVGIGRKVRLICVLGVVLGIVGCQTEQPTNFEPVGVTDGKPAQPEVILLREGDEVTIQYPGAPNLNGSQVIRRDGKIALPLGAGEIVAAGKSVSDLEREILKVLSDQLVNKAVTVTVKSSAFTVYVSGAVLRQGKITSDRPMTALQAVMEAGVDHRKANLSKVKIVRAVGDSTEQFVLDLSRAFKNLESKPFYLKPGDIIFVPEKFTWL